MTAFAEPLLRARRVANLSAAGRGAVVIRPIVEGDRMLVNFAEQFDGVRMRPDRSEAHRTIPDEDIAVVSMADPMIRTHRMTGVNAMLPTRVKPPGLWP